MFNFLILLKMINYLGRYTAPKLHFFASCHFIAGSRAQPENTSLEAEVNVSKWLNMDRMNVDFFYSDKVKPPNQDDEIQSYRF